MNTMAHIRRNILKLTQPEMAAIACCSQALVSYWESDLNFPNQEHMGRIRSHAKATGIAWDDSWFFEAPKQDAAE